MTLFKTAVLLCVVILAGCESMSVSECKVADWARVGYADGSAGTSQTRLADYAEDCGKTGVAPDPRAYRQGWDAGIQTYCTVLNGWREGTKGRSGKEAVCQGQIGYAGFARYLDAGLQVYRTQEHMRRNDQETDRLQRQLDATAKDDEKKRIREELRSIDYSQRRLRDVLSQQQMMAP